ncbi:HEAT repeat domain-containing protein [Pantoea ananatis]
MERRVQDRLMQMTHDNAPEVRGAAARAFGDAGLKRQEIIDRLLQMSSENAPEVRAEAARALGLLSK